MIRYQRLQDWTAPVAPLSAPFDKLGAIGWIPIAESELLLCAHYYALTVRLDAPAPQVGVVLHPDLLERSLINTDGQWIGAYSPIALRCFPFRLARPPTGDPIADLEHAPIKPAGEPPKLLRLKDDAGTPTAQLQSIYEALKSVWVSQETFQPAIDAMAMADLLVPIDLRADGSATLFTIDRRRLAQLSKLALSTMVRRSFLPIDLATALTYSQMHLKAAFRPTTSAGAEAEIATAGNDRTGGSVIDMLAPWLDTSELFPGAWAADPSIWSPPQASPEEATAAVPG